MKVSLYICIALAIPFFSSCDASNSKESDTVIKSHVFIENQTRPITNPMSKTALNSGLEITITRIS